MIKIQPINNRFKRLIHDFGHEWVVIDGPKPMRCFGGDLGVTCYPKVNLNKISNFKNSEVLWVKA
jgi:hypothetical protein